MPKNTLTSYIVGFLLSVALTFAAFFVVIRPGFFHLGSMGIIATIITLALVQFFVQLFFFLHLAAESAPRWKLIVFLSTVSIVLIVVIGSLWIMHNLNYRMMPAAGMDAYILHDEGIRR